MKSLLLVLLMSLVLIVSVDAWELSWDASDGDPDGYNVFYCTVETSEDITETDVGHVLVFELDNLGLLTATRYEFWVTAYNATGESSDSDHLRWTYPKDPIIIETLGAPVVITIIP